MRIEPRMRLERGELDQSTVDGVKRLTVSRAISRKEKRRKENAKSEGQGQTRRWWQKVKSAAMREGGAVVVIGETSVVSMPNLSLRSMKMQWGNCKVLV